MSDEFVEEIEEIEAADSDANASPSSSFLRKKIGNKIPVWILLLIVGLMVGCGVCSLPFAGYFTYDRITNNESDLELTPTPFADTGLISPNRESSIVILSDTETITQSLDIPVSIKIEGQSFIVSPQLVENGGEFTASEEEGTAVWLYGTIVNYVLLFADNGSSRPLLEQIAPGSQIVLHTQSGKEIPFTFASRETLPADDASVYTQTSPKITLIVAGDGDDPRLVVTGNYDLDAVSQSTNQSVVELGEPVQVDDLQITATGAVYQLADASSGFANYLVDYQVQSMGLTAVDSSSINYLLIDDFGNKYAYNATVSQFGNNPPLIGFINAGDSTMATAGFQIPIGLSSRQLRFVLTYGAAQALITIPFQNSAAADSAAVRLTAAAVSPDLTTLTLTGEVSNAGDQAVLINESDISLTTNDGTNYWLLSTNPPFPWTIGPGQTIPYSVSFQLPAAEPATFNILNQPFELTGLH